VLSFTLFDNIKMGCPADHDTANSASQADIFPLNYEHRKFGRVYFQALAYKTLSTY
jgi:hypothetical protein